MKFLAAVVSLVVMLSHPTRGAWIEIVVSHDTQKGVLSHPTRGAWIEILESREVEAGSQVAPHTGCVD